ncbi:Rieske (2Fe-2S) protein [Paractinoplanes brasiliensis]|uniref:Cytochrome bc1 complex Rieske iron-sulfur subunit n=1 Tax=Paractinoplanes brasiliensis TaxID=52695 RepID=A0A4R6JNX1_9ACTN|nr:Rieske (2Fe-2S) protein [Actinoplanes brasiliensis]TDO37597.1 nitrite reductase/ring-hydroxylating ferredoxin subunit [Actinoplanes brasiliensis]GID31834.1 iron-sulfur protein [Actinoplanes brasiliensis]
MTDVQTKTDAETSPEEPGRPTASTRRVVLLGAGAAGATAVLAACGTASSTNSNGSDFTDNPGPAGSAAAGGGNGSDSNGGSGGATLAAVGDVPEGGGVIQGDYVITQPTAGVFKAFSKVCTHAGCDVNKIDGGQISCPCHNSKFSIETGQPTSGPANKALPETKVKVDGDNIVAA